jgi:hypothetical protein
VSPGTIPDLRRGSRDTRRPTGLLPQFTAQVAAVTLYLGRSQTRPVLAYALAGASGSICWYGYPSSTELSHSPLELGRLPTALQQLCMCLHNGFKQATTFEGGFPTSTELSR